MHGFARESAGRLEVSNRIFEMRLYNLFLSDEELAGSLLSDAGDLGRCRFVRDGRLDMCAVLEGETIAGAGPIVRLVGNDLDGRFWPHARLCGLDAGVRGIR